MSMWSLIVPRVIACPKCQRKYQVPGDPTGKSLKCASCQTVFKVGAANAGQAGQTKQVDPARQQANQEQLRKQRAEQAAIGVAGPLAGSPGLFPDQPPRTNADPLANHVIQDPGFAEVNMDEIRRKRLAEESKGKRFRADDPLAKFHREQDEQKEETLEAIEKTKKGIRAGLWACGIYTILLIIGGILTMYYEWAFYIVFVLFVVAAIAEGIINVMFIQNLKEDEDDRKETKGFTILHFAILIPLAANAALFWHFAQEHNIKWLKWLVDA